jgi:hypothetical protein
MTTFTSSQVAAVRLVSGAAVTAAIWCGLLPQLLRLEPIARHVALMEERQVDPSAMYYTELDRLPLRPAWIERVLVLWPEGASAACYTQ